MKTAVAKKFRFDAKKMVASLGGWKAASELLNPHIPTETIRNWHYHGLVPSLNSFVTVLVALEKKGVDFAITDFITKA